MNTRYRRPGFFGGFSLFPPVIKFMIISNLVIFLLQILFLNMLRVGKIPVSLLLFKYFSLQPIFGEVSYYSPILGSFFPWQIITYMFIHGNFGHIFFNMFALWMFGVEIENLWGSKKFLIYYFLCGIGAALANLFIAPFFSEVGPTVGASGAVYGVLIAFAFLFPNREIYLYFLFPIKAKYFVIFYIILEVVYVATSVESGIAHIAHLGGAVVGFIYLLYDSKRQIKNIFRSSKNIHDYTDFFSNNNYGQPFEPPREKEPEREVKNVEYKEMTKQELKKQQEEEQKKIQKRIDKILDKLAEKGYDALTDEEKRILFEDSKKLR